MQGRLAPLAFLGMLALQVGCATRLDFGSVSAGSDAGGDVDAALEASSPRAEAALDAESRGDTGGLDPAREVLRDASQPDAHAAPAAGTVSTEVARAVNRVGAGRMVPNHPFRATPATACDARSVRANELLDAETVAIPSLSTPTTVPPERLIAARPAAWCAGFRTTR